MVFQLFNISTPEHSVDFNYFQIFCIKSAILPQNFLFCDFTADFLICDFSADFSYLRIQCSFFLSAILLQIFLICDFTADFSYLRFYCWFSYLRFYCRFFLSAILLQIFLIWDFTADFSYLLYCCFIFLWTWAGHLKDSCRQKFYVVYLHIFISEIEK